MNVRRLFVMIAIIVLAIQLYRPAKTNPPEDTSKTINAVLQTTPEVQQIIGRSCNDCHTYKTIWPWYSYVAPSSWLVTSDVDDGRRHLNLSEWGAYSIERQQRNLSQICTEVQEGGMPLRQYTWIHRQAPLNPQERQSICDWTKAEQQRITEKTGVKVPPPRQRGMQAEHK